METTIFFISSALSCVHSRPVNLILLDEPSRLTQRYQLSYKVIRFIPEASRCLFG